MRFTAQIAFVVLPILAGCATPEEKVSRFVEPNALMGEEIRNRIDEIPYQHREELFHNLLWLAQTGESAIPPLLEALRHPAPKVRSSAAWVLAEIGDRRIIEDLQPLATDGNTTVRLEAARSLLMLGDVKHAAMLIEALDSDQVQVRYLCHEALKASTGRDFGYDHLSDDLTHRRKTVLDWRNWWSSMSGDAGFSRSYATQWGLAASPGGNAQPPATPMQEGAAPVNPPQTQPPAGQIQPPAGQTQPPAGQTEPPAGQTEPPAAQPETQPTIPPATTEPPAAQPETQSTIPPTTQPTIPPTTATKGGAGEAPKAKPTPNVEQPASSATIEFDMTPPKRKR